MIYRARLAKTRNIGPTLETELARTRVPGDASIGADKRRRSTAAGLKKRKF